MIAMPTDAHALSLVRQVADLQKQVRRHAAALAAPTGGFDPNADPIQIGLSANANAEPDAIVIGQSSTANYADDVIVGGFATTNNGGAAFGTGTTATGGNSFAAARYASATGTNAVAIGNNATASFNNSTAVGVSATTTKADQIMFGTSSNFVEIPGNGALNGLVLTDRSTGTRYIIQISSGALVLNTAP